MLEIISFYKFENLKKILKKKLILVFSKLVRTFQILYQKVSFLYGFLSVILHLVFNFLDISITGGGIFQLLFFFNNNFLNSNRITSTTVSVDKIENLMAKDSKEITDTVSEKEETNAVEKKEDGSNSNKKLIAVLAVVGTFFIYIFFYSIFPGETGTCDITELVDTPVAAPPGMDEPSRAPIAAPPGMYQPIIERGGDSSSSYSDDETIKQ